MSWEAGGVGAFAAVAVALAFVAVNLVAHLRESRELRRVAGERLGLPPASREHLVRLLEFLHERVSYEGLDKNMRRPLLRQGAYETLRSGKGFCGENARLAIRLMNFIGIPAARIYVSGEKWPHVLTECQLDGRWWLFDGHNDPETAMTPAEVGAIESPRIDQLRNHHPNAYIAFQRIRLFHGHPGLERLEKMRLPNWMIQILESPHMLKAIAGIFAIIMVTVLWRLL